MNLVFRGVWEELYWGVGANWKMSPDRADKFNKVPIEATMTLPNGREVSDLLRWRTGRMKLRFMRRPK